MATLNGIRAVLVGAAVIAMLVAAVFGEWLAVGVLAVGVAVHGFLWVYMYRIGLLGHHDRPTAPPPTGG
jgi:hypothetical protein